MPGQGDKEVVQNIVSRDGRWHSTECGLGEGGNGKKSCS